MLDKAKLKINQGRSILDKWDREYSATKKRIEEECNDRWVSKPKAIQEKVPYMLTRLQELDHIVEVQQNFFNFLGPTLKSIVSDTEGIDSLRKKVIDLVQPFILFGNEEIFNKNRSGEWKGIYSGFNQKQSQIENETMDLIQETFKFLRSSINTFDFLLNFKSIQTLKQIKDQMELKYSEVLMKYDTELKNNQNLFNKYKDSLNVSKHQPKISGQIHWALSIYKRIKQPWLKFKQKEDILEKNLWDIITNKYIELAIQIDNYQESIWKAWDDNVANRARELVTLKIIKDTGNSYKKYKVNFQNDLKVLIKEVKQLEKLGYQSTKKTIIDTAIQERSYQKDITHL